MVERERKALNIVTAGCAREERIWLEMTTH